MRSTSNDGEKPHALVIPAVPLVIPAEPRDEPSARHSPVVFIHGRVRRKWTPGQSPGPRPPAGIQVTVRTGWIPAVAIDGSEDDHVL